MADLRRVTERVLDHLAELGYTDVEFPFDAYWHVTLDEAFSPAKKPKDLGLGSLEEDWAELERLLGDGTGDVLVTDLRPLAAILNALNHVVWELPEMRARSSSNGSRD